MKNRFVCFILIIILSMLCLISCEDTDSKDTNTNNNQTDESTQKPSDDKQNDSTQKPSDDKPNDSSQQPATTDSNYQLVFTSNGDGTCTVTIKTSINPTEKFTVSIPEKSPEGDTVTAIGDSGFTYCMDIPHVATKEEFEKLKTELINNIPGGENAFIYRKFTAYYVYIDVNNCNSDSQINAMYERYPLAKIMPFYIMDNTATVSEYQNLYNIIKEYAPSYTAEYWATKATELDNRIKESEIQMTIPRNRSDYISAIELPSTIKEIKKHAFTELLIDNISLPEGVEKIEAEAFYKSEIKTIKIPSTATEIESRAFYQVTADNVLIPNSIQNIVTEAFFNSNIKKFTTS